MKPMTDGDLAIETRGLSKRFGDVTAVDALDLSIRRGELFALLGVNGAGKTTTIRMLTTLARPTGGTARVCGYDLLTESREVKRVSGISPQQTVIAQGLTVRENLMLMTRLYGATTAQAEERTDALLSALSLGDVAGRRAKVLSGGYQRRLSIALALASDPGVLYLDEPTLGLDVLARRELWHLISRLRGEKTIVLTTHYLEEAEALSDRVGVMAGGHLLAVDTPEGLKKSTGCDNFEDAFIRLVGGEARI